MDRIQIAVDRSPADRSAPGGPDAWAFDAWAAGPLDGPLVLLLHGFPQTGWAWHHQIPALARAGYRAVAPDQRGYSPGARPQEVAAYHVRHLVDDVLGLADRLGAATFHLVGHDWGAAVAWELAARHPDRLRTLVSVSTPHPQALARALKGDDQRRRSRYMTLFRSRAAEPVLTWGRAAGLRLLYRLSGLEARDAQPYLQTLRFPDALTPALNYYRANAEWLSAGTGVIQTPTLFVWGDHDPALGPEAAGSTGEYVVGPYQFEILRGEGHWLPELAAPVLNRLLLEHVAR